jgi:hypothetical protein
MSNDNVDLINDLIKHTILLKKEITKLNNRLNARVVKEMIRKDIIDNSLLFNHNSYLDNKRYVTPFNIEDGLIVVEFN